MVIRTRRWAPPAALVGLAVTWSAINMATYEAGKRNGRTFNDLATIYLNRRELAAGRPALPPPTPIPMGWSVEWRLLGPGLLLLVGAALLAVLLRRRVRGPWWLAVGVAPAFTGDYGSLKEAFMAGAAGYGPTTYAIPPPSFSAQGFSMPVYSVPSWLVGAVAALGTLLLLAPALCAPRDPQARAISRRRLLAATTVAFAATLGMLAVQSVSASSGPEVAWRGPVGGALLVFAVGLTLSDHGWRAMSGLWAVAALLIAGTTGVSPGQLAVAAGWAALAVAAGQVATIRWKVWRARINGSGPTLATQP